MTASNIEALDFKPQAGGSAVRRLILGGALLIAAIAIATAVTVASFRERALNTTERELENTVLLLANHLNQQFEEFEVVQKDLAANIRSTGIASSEAFARQASTPEMREILQKQEQWIVRRCRHQHIRLGRKTDQLVGVAASGCHQHCRPRLFQDSEIRLRVDTGFD